MKSERGYFSDRVVVRIERQKKKWNWEPSVPRCGSCAHYQHDESKTPIASPHCIKGGFFTRKNALCDKWEGEHDGATLA